MTAQPRGSGLSIFTTVAQVFCTPRPVLVPPWTVKPPRSRAFAVKSTPCQYHVRAGPKLVSNVWKFWAPRAERRRRDVVRA